MQRCNVEPYKGNQPYLFVSYSHKEEDKAIVYPILERMEQAGFRLWFDQGIEATSEWATVVCAHLKAASACLFCLSPNFANSGNCLDELYLAKNGAAKRVTLFLKSDFQMDPELELGLVRQQQIFLESYNNIEELIKYLKQDENLQICLDDNSQNQGLPSVRENSIHKELQGETLLSGKNCELQKAIDSLMWQALESVDKRPPQNEKAISLLQQVDEIQKQNGIDDCYLPSMTLGGLGRAYMHLGCQIHGLSDLADIDFKSISKQQVVFLTRSYQYFNLALHKDKTMSNSLCMMSILQLFAGFTNDTLSNDDLLIWLKTEAPKDPDIPIVLGAYYEKNHLEKEMLYWYKIATQKNPSNPYAAAYRLGRYCVEHRTHGHDAMEVLLPFGERKDPEACYLIGCLYRYGIGVEKNRSKAKEFLRTAAKRGSKDAASDLKTFWF